MLDEPKIDQRKRALVDAFLSDSARPKYLLGTNQCAEQLARQVEIDAYIDDFTEQKSFLGKPVIRSGEAEKSAIVVSCSLAIYPHSAMRSLEKAGIKKILHYLDVAKYAKDLKLPLLFVDHALHDLELNYSEYKSVFKKLCDEVSKKTFLDLLNFRKNRDISYLSSYRVDFIGQYFEDFLKLSKDDVFVDIGAFDGNTTIEFIKHCPEYKAVYVFEPSPINLLKAQENLSSYQNIHFFPMGLSDQKALLKFDAQAGSASSASETGEAIIRVDSLDNILKDPVSFIKMDIEGAEAKAIAGMVGHILTSHPKMAISVYHRPNDLWFIPKQILEIRSDYDIYIRHYTEGTDETVMFFLPNGN